MCADLTTFDDAAIVNEAESYLAFGYDNTDDDLDQNYDGKELTITGIIFS